MKHIHLLLVGLIVLSGCASQTPKTEEKVVTLSQVELAENEAAECIVQHLKEVNDSQKSADKISEEIGALCHEKLTKVYTLSCEQKFKGESEVKNCLNSDENKITLVRLKTFQKSQDILASELEKKAQCMVNMANGQNDKYKAVVSIAYNPSGVARQDKNGAHTCKPLKRADSGEILASQGFAIVSGWSTYCEVKPKEAQDVTKIFFKKMVEASPEFSDVYKSAMTNKALCP